jgi:hypothetical protein
MKKTSSPSMKFTWPFLNWQENNWNITSFPILPGDPLGLKSPNLTVVEKISPLKLIRKKNPLFFLFTGS